MSGERLGVRQEQARTRMLAAVMNRRVFSGGCAALVSSIWSGDHGGGTPAAAGAIQPPSPQPAEKSEKRWMTAETRTAIQRGLQFLATEQNPDGSFGSDGLGRNVAVVALAGMAFLAEGSLPSRGRFAKPLGKCLQYILKNAQPSGFIRTPNSGNDRPMYGHGFATLFLAEAYGTTDDVRVRESLAKAVQLIVNTQNSEGGWRYQPRRQDADISVTICQIMALRAARNAGIHVPNETVERCTQFVKRCQNPDGGFMYMLSQPGVSRYPRSAAAIVALYSVGIYDSEEIRRALAYLEQNRDEMVAGSTAQATYYFYALYYAAQAMWHAGEVRWRSWYPAVRDELLRSQQPAGQWVDTDRNGPAYATAVACLVLLTPSNYLPIFQK